MWRSKVVLKEGEVLTHVSSKSKGFMQEEDIDEYEIYAGDGSRTGGVIVNDHTAVRDVKRTITVTQFDIDGKVVLTERFTSR